ncbi:type VII secretion protein EssC [Bacillus toyonensis]|uniref:type VII secretion protein EssC n=1 Tax=Bacillus cereus group TaxID=86661 RepID=UPI000BEE3524|nr:MULTISPECIES: type VII secretion protein EssC [Bacillus cereus group]MBJ7931261.1 type VII secretion protein EssC [Bacillus cereus group sp. N31]PEG13215.1 type VII secretion protein EssC [Bacillus toyonensis]QWH88599.1 type VII secretion protein EssC [Bacillus toyonensis]QWI31773.1 type VII secretion protein EssC [Bacillus toyonensis]
MEQLLVLTYGDKIYKCTLHPTEQSIVSIGKEWTNDITNPSLEQEVELKWNNEVNVWMIQDQLIEFNKEFEIGKTKDVSLKIFISIIGTTKVFDIGTKHSLTFSQNSYDDISITGSSVDIMLSRETLYDSFKVNVYDGEVFHNYTRLKDSAMLEAGDQLYFDGVLVEIGSEDIQVLSSEDKVKSTLPILVESETNYQSGYPDYHRSPRIIYREPEEKMTIAKPSSMPSKPTEHLARIIAPALVMIVVTVLLAIFMKYGMFIIASIAMTLVTIIVSVTSYIKNLKQYKIDIVERDKSYREYIKQKTKDLHAESEKQRHALHYHNPNVEVIRNMAVQVNPRIYEKTMQHHDFLTFSVGTGQANTSFEIQFNEEEFSQTKDELIDIARELRQRYLSLEDVPVVTDLMNGPVGYIGQRSLVLEQLQLLVAQTALFHSYYDLQFITIFPEEEKEKWDWMRWLPHGSVRDINVRGFVYHDRSRDQVLNSLYQILKERKLKLDEKSSTNEKMYFAPHYVVLITDEKLILDHVVMEFFNDDPSQLGVSLVFVQDVMQSLPEHVKTVIDIRDAKQGNIILEQGELVNRQFKLNHVPKGFNLEDVSRALAPLNHLQNLKNSIPESVTFLEMYGVEKIKELNITKRWEKNAAHKSLAVPLGLRGKEDIVNLNLHEKAHGPHGLIAGTTGSGKSEIIQSYILSLAVNFHPYEVAFLLIDYKGGGMANLFKNLPHLLGTITNLDGAQSMRALASIKAELQKRQRLFGENDVNHINQYQKLYKEGLVSEPMPHLFLISDEFAELKSEQPEFMKELVSTARIGRSLGIHLILATQKPSGVVDDQIWSNSKFKLALKVQNTSDSNEILKTPDAAEITLPGRAYLQVGNNEIYELFQSAWSGADYVENKEDKEHLDATIYAINDLGQYEILSEDLSGLGSSKEVISVPSELDAVIDYIHDYAEVNEIEALARPWLPPLPESVYLQDLHAIQFKEAWTKEKKPLKATVGLLDQPELQSQTPLTLDISKDGHVAVFSSPGYGKSTFLQSVIMDVARQHSPEHLHVYLLDFGTNGLMPLKSLPHVADIITLDQVEKCEKFLRRIEDLLKDRKQLLSKYGVASLEMYERASKEVLPTILITLDNYDAVREAGFVEDFERIVAQIVREGAAVGIHLMLTATRQNALRVQVNTNIKLQIALYMIDEAESRAIVGRTDLKIEELAGRGLVKIDEPTIFQTALPTNGEDVLTRIENIQAEGKEMDSFWDGERPKAIPMVPEVLEYKEFIAWPETRKIIEAGKLTFGVETESVTPLELDLTEAANIVVGGIKKDEVENVVHQFLQQLADSGHFDLGLIDTRTRNFSNYRESAALYVAEKTGIEKTIKQVTNAYKSREAAFKEEQEASSETVNPAEFIKKFKSIVIVIADVNDILSNLEDSDIYSLAELITNGAFMGIHFVIGCDVDSIDSRYDLVSKTIKTQSHVILLRKSSGQMVFDVSNKDLSSTKLNPFEGYFVENRFATRIKVPTI